MTDITPADHQLVSALVDRSLGLLSEVTEIEKQMRLLLADITIAGLGGRKCIVETSNSSSRSAPFGSSQWNRN